MDLLSLLQMSEENNKDSFGFCLGLCCRFVTVAADGEDCGACWKLLPGLQGTASAERTDRKEKNVHKPYQKKPFELV